MKLDDIHHCGTSRTVECKKWPDKWDGQESCISYCPRGVVRISSEIIIEAARTWPHPFSQYTNTDHRVGGTFKPPFDICRHCKDGINLDVTMNGNPVWVHFWGRNCQTTKGTVATPSRVIVPGDEEPI